MVHRPATVAELSALPGLIHGFGRRAEPMVREPRDETLLRARAALAATGRLLLMRQVHGTVVLRAPWEGTPEADAATADRTGLVLGIATADCLPILLVDPARRAVAAAHAGWRGTTAGVVARTVETLLRGGSRPDDVVAAIGPGIGPCCYEVGLDLRNAFAGGDAFFRPGPRGRPHLDLRTANRAQLRDAGVPAHRIHHVEECTSCHPDLYYSYRRDGPGTGRMISFIGYRSQSQSGDLA